MVRQLTSEMEMMWYYNRGKVEQQSKNPAAFWFLNHKKKKSSGVMMKTWRFNSC